MEDDSAGDTADLLGLSEFSSSSREAKETSALLQQPIWQPSRKASSRSERGKEKLYQGRASAQQQKATSVSPPSDVKPKLMKTKSPQFQREAESRRPKRLSKSNSSEPEPIHHRQPQAELKRPKRLSQSNISHRRRSMSLGSVSSDDLREVLNDGPCVKQPFARRRSRSASPSFQRPALQKRPSTVQRRPSLQSHQRRPSLQRRPSAIQRRPSAIQRRPSLQKRPSTQSIQSQSNSPLLLRRSSNQELSSRSILAESLQDNNAILHRRRSFTTITTLHVPLKDEPRPGRERSRNGEGHVRRRSRSLDGRRGRSRKNEDGYIRRRSRSLDGRFQTDDIMPVAPLNDKPRNRRRSISYDSAASENSNPTDFKEELEKRRASKKAEVETRDSAEVKEDLEKRKAAIKAGVEVRTRHSMPAMRTTKKDEKEKEKEKRKQRHSMPITKRKGRADPSEEENRKETPSEEVDAGESIPRRRRRRPKTSEGVSRLHSSFNKSWNKALNRRRKPPPAPAAEALYASPAAAAAGVASREATDENDVERNDVESYRRKKKRGCYVSRFMMTVMCFCYLFSLVGVFAVGFWTHMEFFAYKDTERTVNKNAGLQQDSYENNTTMLRPSSSSSTFDPSGSANINLQPFPTDGGMGTKVEIPAEASNNPSSNPTPIVSGVPSLTPTSSPYPTSTPSIPPSNVASESPSSKPTVTRSESPSSSPTILEECPETLSRSMPFISDTELTLYYETVIYRDHPTGGLLCASLEYSGSAGWIGIAFSTAGRNPQFGRREAIIGMPGVDSAVAVSAQNVTSSALNPSGSQNNFVEGGPSFVNPGKYDIRAGGLDGYYGPSLQFLMSDNQQTLLNASVTTSDDDSNQTVTRLSFAKYLREPGEIEINPLGGPTLILYAVAPIDPSSGLYIDENPQWKYINMILGDGRSNTRSSFMRKRQHNNFGD